MNNVSKLVRRGTGVFAAVTMVISLGTLAAADVRSDIADRLETALASYQSGSSININIKDLNVSDVDIVRAGVEEFRAENPETYYISGSFSYSTYGSTINSVSLSVDSTKYSKRATFSSKVNSVVNGLDSSWNTTEKLLYFHDYLATHCQYDTAGSNNDAYECLVNGSSKCDGYSRAMASLCRKAGIKCDIITSKVNNHAWNLVTVDGSKYYMDVTWDDPIFNGSGKGMLDYVQHGNFLTSTSACEENKHKGSDWLLNGWQTGYGLGSSTKYDSLGFKKTPSAPVYIGGHKWLYGITNTSGIKSVNLSSLETADYASTYNLYYPFMTGDSQFVILGSNNRIYFVKSGKATVVYTLSDSDYSTGIIVGVSLSSDKKTVTYTLNKQADKTVFWKTGDVDISSYVSGITVTPTNTNTPTPRPTDTNTPTPKPTDTNTPTPKPTDTNTPTPKPTDTNTPTPKPTDTNTPTPRPTDTNTPTPKPTDTNTPTPKPTDTNTPTPKPTDTNTPTPRPTNTNTPVPKPTHTNTPRPTNTNTPIPKPTHTNTPRPTVTPVSNTPVDGKPTPLPDVDPASIATSTPAPVVTHAYIPTATPTLRPVYNYTANATPTAAPKRTIYRDIESYYPEPVAEPTAAVQPIPTNAVDPGTKAAEEKISAVKITEILNSDNGISLKWSISADAKTYNVLRSVNGSKFTLLRSLDRSLTYFTDDKIVNGNLYAYKIESVNGEAWAQSEAATICRLDTVKVTKKKSGKKGRANLKWTKNPKANGYQIQYVLNNKVKTINVKKAKTVSKTIKKLKSKKKYQFSVRSYKQVGKIKYYGNWSKSYNIKIK